MTEQIYDQNNHISYQKRSLKDSCESNEDYQHTMDTQKASKYFGKKDCKYRKAINSLEEYSLPTIIPCREKEKDVIMDFLINGFEGRGCASTLYISGFPGVGKTIVVSDTIERFKLRLKKRASDFMDIRINAMNLMKPHAIYISILKQITGLDIPAYKALPTLNEILSRGSFPKSLHTNLSQFTIKEIMRKIKKTKIMFIDEVDYLFTKDEDVLYNIFQWTHKPFSKIVLITASNTFTFPEELEQKILSRIGSERLNFMTYTSSQIEEILDKRLSELKIFESQGLRYISKRLSTTSDIRKCLYILRQCIIKHLELKKKGTLITMNTINDTLKQIYDNPLINSLKNLPEKQKAVLLSILEVMKETGIYCWLSQLLIQMKIKDKTISYENIAQIEETLTKLRELNIIKMSMRERHKRKSITSKEIPTHVSEFKIELNIESTALLKAFDVL